MEAGELILLTRGDNDIAIGVLIVFTGGGTGGVKRVHGDL